MSVQGRFFDKAMYQRSKRVTGSFADQNVSQARVYNTLMLASRWAIDQNKCYHSNCPDAKFRMFGTKVPEFPEWCATRYLAYPRVLGLGVVRG